MNIKQVLNDIYLTYVNDYLTISKFAEHQEMDVSDLNYLIELGRLIHKNQYEETRNLNRNEV